MNSFGIQPSQHVMTKPDFGTCIKRSKKQHLNLLSHIEKWCQSKIIICLSEISNGQHDRILEKKGLHQVRENKDNNCFPCLVFLSCQHSMCQWQWWQKQVENVETVTSSRSGITMLHVSYFQRLFLGFYLECQKYRIFQLG